MRSALRVGVPEVVRRLEVRPAPRRSLAEYLDAFCRTGPPQPRTGSAIALQMRYLLDTNLLCKSGRIPGLEIGWSSISCKSPSLP